MRESFLFYFINYELYVWFLGKLVISKGSIHKLFSILSLYELSNDDIYLVKQIHEQQQDSRPSDGGQDDDPQRNDVRFDGQVPGDDLREYLVTPNLGEFTFRLANVLELGDFC